MVISIAIASRAHNHLFFTDDAPFRIIDGGIIAETPPQYKGVSAKFNITLFVFLNKVRILSKYRKNALLFKQKVTSSSRYSPKFRQKNLLSAAICDTLGKKEGGIL
jgi:hypothetical protein